MFQRSVRNNIFNSSSTGKNDTAPDIDDDVGWHSNHSQKKGFFPSSSTSSKNNNDDKKLLQYIRDLENRLESVEQQLEQTGQGQNGGDSEKRPLLQATDDAEAANQDDEDMEEGSIRVFGNDGEEEEEDFQAKGFHPQSQSQSKLQSQHGEEGEDNLVQFPLDTFGFLIVSKACSIPFFTAWGVIALKNTIFLMVILDLAGRKADGISGLIPVLVSQSVFITQLISYGLLILTQNDLLSAATLLYRGHSEDIERVFVPGGKKWQWLLSVIMAFADGAFGISTTFLLVVTSDTVLDVILNFAAVAFVSDLDEIFFALAQIGILGKANFLAAECIAEKSYRSPMKTAFGGVQTIRSGLVIALMSTTLSLGILVYARQRRGYYTADSVYVQLASDVRPNLALHSGFYQRRDIRGLTGILNTGREGFVYMEEREGGMEGRGKIAYCISRSVWTFTWGEGSACSNTLIESSNTDSYDVVEAATSPWFVRLPGLSQSIPMKGFYLSTGCDTDSDCGGGSDSEAHKTGTCHHNRCQCTEGFSGIQCLYSSENTCPEVILDEQVSTSYPTERNIATEFQKYNGGECYGRPVYWNSNTQDVIFFSGARWVLTRLDQVLPTISNTSETASISVNQTETLEFLVSDSFHSSLVKKVDLLSEEVLFRTAIDGDNSPATISWLGTGSTSKDLGNVDEVVSLPLPGARLVCSKCNDETNPCQNEGICLANGKCDCSNSNATGTRCEVLTPTN